MSENKHTTLDQMKDFAQRQDARDDVQEERLAQHEEALGGVVKYTEQALTDEQKAQARENIGAGTSDHTHKWSDVEDPVCGDVIETSGTLTWDGDVTGRTVVGGHYFKVSDVIPTKKDFANGYSCVNTDGTESEITTYDGETAQSAFGEDGLGALHGGLVAVVPTDNYVLNGNTFPEAGIYFFKSGAVWVGDITIEGYSGFTNIKTIRMPEKYFPESVESVTIRSSTEGSTKKFKVTVDDSGTISATEVTE